MSLEKDRSLAKRLRLEARVHLALLHPYNSFIEEAELRNSKELLRDVLVEGERGIVVAAGRRAGVTEVCVQFSDGCSTILGADADTLLELARSFRRGQP